MRSIGLDIGDYSAKIVELVHNKKSVSIVQIHEKILTQNIAASDKELEVIEFVRGFMSSSNYQDVKWILAVRSDQATTRFKTFPFSDRIKILKSLSFEMEEDIPFDPDSCIFDAKLICTNGSSSDVLATAVPKNHIEKIIDLASSFGIQLHAVSVESLAFSNLIEDFDQPAPQFAANINLDEETEKPRKQLQVILNIGHRKTLFTAFENKRLVFSRNLYWGANQILKEIIHKQEISYVEALYVLHKQSAIFLNKENISFEQAQLSSIITSSVKDLVRDLQMTTLELESEFNADITGLHYTGGASLIPNLGGYLTQHLNIPCNPIYLLQSYIGQVPEISTSEQAQEFDSRFNTAVAIAMEGFKKSRNPCINLLKGEFTKQNDQFKNFWLQWGGLAQVTLAALIVLFVWTSLRGNFSLTLTEKSEEAIKLQAKNVARLPKKQATENGVRKYIKEHKKKAAEMKLITHVASLNSALEILQKVSSNAPSKEQSKIDLLSFHVKDDLVQLMGYANTPKEVSDFTNGLKQISVDGQVNNQAGKLTPIANRVSFSISFKADRGLTK